MELLDFVFYTGAGELLAHFRDIKEEDKSLDMIYGEVHPIYCLPHVFISKDKRFYYLEGNTKKSVNEITLARVCEVHRYEEVIMSYIRRMLEGGPGRKRGYVVEIDFEII
jgi:hypothetical protein